MRNNPMPADVPDAAYAWLDDGSMAPTRTEVLTQAASLVALLFGLGIGIVIAALPLVA
jgi:hypothetical protein